MTVDWAGHTAFSYVLKDANCHPRTCSGDPSQHVGSGLDCRNKSDNDNFEQAIKQARLGIGRTAPNPPVGAVVAKDGKIIAAAHHPRAGELHAEPLALKAAGTNAYGATLYVTLEPCDHTGKTPPCTQAIIAAGVREVVYGAGDPNPLVNGRGLLKLKQAGVAVRQIADPELLRQAQRLIMPFSKHMLQGRPWVVGKMATSLDGKIVFKKGEPLQISGPEWLNTMHKLRNACDAIITSSSTVISDNPRLTTRLKEADGRNPLRVVLDSKLRTDPASRVYDTKSGASLVFCTKDAPESRRKAFEQAQVRVMEISEQDGRVNLDAALEALSKRGILSVLLDCGGELFSSFVYEKQIDELWWAVSPMIIGEHGTGSFGKIAMDRPNSIPDGKWKICGQDMVLVAPYSLANF